MLALPRIVRVTLALVFFVLLNCGGRTPPAPPPTSATPHAPPAKEVAIEMVPQVASVRSNRAALSPDGRIVAAGTQGGFSGSHVALWDAATGTLLRIIPSLAASALDFTPDGARLVTGGGCDQLMFCDGVNIWDVRTGNHIRAIPSTWGDHRTELTALAVSRDGSKVGAVLKSHRVGSRMVVCDLASGATLWTHDVDEGRWVELAPGLDAFTARDAHATELFAFAGKGAVTDPAALGAPPTRRGTVSADGALELRDGDGKDGAPLGLFLRDTKTGRVLRSLNGAGTPCLDGAVGPDGKWAACAMFDGSVWIWDLATASPRRVLRLGVAGSGGIAASPDGKALAVVSGKMVFLADVATGATIASAKLAQDGYETCVFSPDGARLFVGGSDVAVYAVGKSLTLLARLPIFGVEIAVSPDGKRLLAGSGSDIARMFDAKTGANIRDYDFRDRGPGAHIQVEEASAVAFSPDGRLGLFGLTTGAIKLFEIESGKTVATLIGHSPFRIRGLSFSSDGLTAVSAGFDRSVRVWDLGGQKQIGAFEGHRDEVMSAAFTPDRRFVISASRDGTLRLWRTDGGESFVMTSSGDDWLAYTENGYFDASRRGGRLAMAIDGTTPHAIDQLAIRNNRPDILLERIGLADPALIAHYRARHARRLERAGLTEDQLEASFGDAPDARFSDLRQDGKVVELSAHLTTRKGQLQRYNVYVNGMPVLGDGKAVSGQDATVRERIPVTAGSNKIEVSVVSSTGIESMRDMRRVDVAADGKGALYFLGIGVSKYKNSALDLSYAHKDALDLEVAVKKLDATFSAVHTKTLTDQAVITANIRDAKSFLDAARPEDTVIVFVAGHGTHTRDAAADYYYVTHDVDLKHLRETAAPFELIEGLVTDVAARQKLLVLDTCESGDRDEIDDQPAIAAAGTRGLRSRSTRALVLSNEGDAAPPKPRPFLLDRNRYIYNDLQRRSGAIVFASSYGTELSYEFDDQKNGAFTAELKTALSTDRADRNHDGTLTLGEVVQFVNEGVAKRTNGSQHPTVDRDNPDVAIELRVPSK